ncbi:hypothetical protein EBT31_09200 [bacterium]|mgnify:CR=1 FL=1|jgi:hypothetical protein|nr:hypothetical protein [bacterium]
MLRFFSNALSTEIEFEKLDQLSNADLETLHKELSELVTTLSSAVSDAKAKAAASGVPLDPHWLHRINTKKRITLKFATEINSRLQGGTTVEQRAEYDRIYRAQFRAILLEEFGEEELLEIEQEVLDKARAAYHDWIASTKQRAWFVP